MQADNIFFDYMRFSVNKEGGDDHYWVDDYFWR